MILRIVLFVGLALAVFYVAHFLFYMALRHLLPVTGRGLRRALFIILSLLSISFPLAFFAARLIGAPWSRTFYLASGVWAGLLINLLLASVLLLPVVLCWRLFIGRRPGRRIALVIYALGVITTAYGAWSAFHPVVRQVAVALPNLPANWAGKTIVHLTDVHLGHVHGPRFLQRVVDQVNALSPEMIVITGDLFDGLGGNPGAFVALLGELRAARGVYFVTGNHEQYAGLGRILQILDRTPIRVLQNEVLVLDGLRLVGIAYPGLRPTRDRRTLQALEASLPRGVPAVLLFHTPTDILQADGDPADHHTAAYWRPDTSFATARRLGIDLQLSGHTHRGQVLPFNLLTRLIYRGYDYGLHSDGDFVIFTSCGTGTWGPPIRTGQRPEIVAIRLTPR